MLDPSYRDYRIIFYLLDRKLQCQNSRYIQSINTPLGNFILTPFYFSLFTLSSTSNASSFTHESVPLLPNLNQPAKLIITLHFSTSGGMGEGKQMD